MRELTKEEHQLVEKTTNYHWFLHGRMWKFGRMEKEDVRQLAYLGICKAIETHNPEKSPLNYWQKMYMRAYILGAFQKIDRWKEPLTKTSEVIDANSDVMTDISGSVVGSELATEILNVTESIAEDDADVKALILTSINGMQSKEAAEVLGTTDKKIYNMKRRAKIKLYRAFDEAGFFVDGGYNPNEPAVKRRK